MYLCGRERPEVRLHLGNEQARCSRFALTLAAEKERNELWWIRLKITMIKL